MDSRTHQNTIPKQKTSAKNTKEAEVKREAAFQFEDNRPQTIAQRKLQEIASNNAQLKQQDSVQSVTNNHTTDIIQKKKKNNTGLPDQLKSGVENLSGIDISDTKVHYNSPKPAQFHAHAFAQGPNIYVAPGQEKHLPHEAWHVTQQKQGRVQATKKINDISVNDNPSLEQEAEMMGTKSLQLKQTENDESNLSVQKNPGTTIQRVRGLLVGANVKFFDKETRGVLQGRISAVDGNKYEIGVLENIIRGPDDPPPLEDVYTVEEGVVFPDNTVTEAIEQRFSVQVLGGGDVRGDDYRGGIIGGPIVIDEEYFGKAPEGPSHMGGNLAFERVPTNDMIFTDAGRGFMRLETEAGGDLDKLVRKHRALSEASMGLMRKDPTLAEKFKRLLDSVHAIPTNQEARDKQIKEEGSENLAAMINSGFTMCWEKAAFMHLMLTDLGIRTEILQGPMKTKHDAHHAWVGIVGTDFVVESTAGFVATRANYLKTFDITATKVVARPKESLAVETIIQLILASGKLKADFVPKSN